MDIEKIKKLLMNKKYKRVNIIVGNNKPDDVQHYLLCHGIKWNNNTSWDFSAKNAKVFIIVKKSGYSSIYLLYNNSVNIQDKYNPQLTLYFNNIVESESLDFVNNLFKNIL